MAGNGASLDGKVVVITGASGSLGPAVARAFASRGASLALAARREEALSRLASDLALPPERVLTVTADLSQPPQAQSLASSVVERFGRVDALLHLVGGYEPGGPVAELTLAKLQTMLDLNLMTAFNALHSFLPHLSANGWGRIVAVSAALAQQPSARSALYSVSKAALEALIMTVAQEVKAQGITANLLVIRTLDTPENRQAAPKANYAAWTTPEELAAVMLYLCTDEAAVINGARIPLFGKG